MNEMQFLHSFPNRTGNAEARHAAPVRNIIDRCIALRPVLSINKQSRLPKNSTTAATVKLMYKLPPSFPIFKVNP